MNSGQVVVVVGGMGPSAPVHATTTASLVGLPNELLYKIFTHLSNQNLFTLAAGCHRLHLVALSTYFSAHGIDTGSLLSTPNFVFTSKQMAALPGLLRMSIRPRVKSVRFVWRGRRPESVIVREVSRVARWIKMLDDLEELDLDFPGVSFGHFADMIHYGAQRYPLVGFRTWDYALMQLLDEISRSPCQRLYIHDTLSNCWPNPIPRSSPPAIAHVPRTFDNSRPRTRLEEQNGSPGLQSLSLDCSFLFKSSDMIEWTVSTLTRSSATLTTLSIVDHRISTECFAAMLPLLHLPLLSTLSISASSLQFADLSNFPVRHPAITVLKLLRGELCCDDSREPSWNLPRLRTLCATPDYADLLLRGRGHNRFPELDSITIEPKSCYSSSAQSTEKALWAVSQFHGMWGAKARKNKRLSLSMTVDPGDRGYLNLSASHRAWPYSRPEQRLHRVETLYLVTKPEEPLSPKIVIRWLRLFPALKYVGFTGTCLPPMDHTERVEYVRQASAACPRLQTVHIDSVKATVHEWLEGPSVHPTCASYSSSLEEIHI